MFCQRGGNWEMRPGRTAGSRRSFQVASFRMRYALGL
jgi:hypothetical protein